MSLRRVVIFAFVLTIAKTSHADEVEEVKVRGKRQEVGKTSLGASEIRQVPGAFGDAFRAVEVLPGVTPIVSGLPYFFVRGAPPGNTGYFVDGVRVPLLFHFGIAQAVIHPALVDHVDFHAGGYPARYGRFTGGIIAGETIAPAHRVHGEYNARLLDSGALVEAPVGERSEVLVAGRYGYPGLLLRAFAPQARLDYWDYQARGSTALDGKNRLTLFAFGSHDFIGSVDRKTGELEGATTIRFHRADARLDHAVSPDTHVRVAFTLGYDETSAENASVRDALAAVRTIWESRLSDKVLLRGGADATFDHYDSTAQKASNGDLGEIPGVPPRAETQQGIWMDAIVKVTPRYELVPGARVDYFANDGTTLGLAEGSGPGAAKVGFDPRIASRLRLSRSVVHVATAGLAHQMPSFPGTIPGLQPGTLSGGLQRAVQIGQGVELLLPAEITVTPTVFLHNYLGMTDALTTCALDDGDSGGSEAGCAEQRVRGRAYGFELLARRALTKRVSGLISYTLSRSTRQTREPVRGAQLGEIPSEFDRTHVLNLIGAIDLGRGWRAGARFFYYTGRPYSDRIAGVNVPPYNQKRFDPFYRFDWRIEKRWSIGRFGRISLVLEMLNTLLRKEALSLDCKRVKGELYDRCTPREIGPITIPSIGVEGAF
jgi:hypothetical protein